MKTYIEELEERLLDHQISGKLLNDIITEYSNKLELSSLENSGLDSVDAEVEFIIEKYDLKLKEYDDRDISTLIAIVPFVTLISYFILGFGMDFWHPGWLVFILIPILFLVFSVFHDDFLAGILALIPFSLVFSYFFIGFYYHIWHPTWLIFMLLPVVGVFTTYRKKGIITFLYALSPLFALTFYILIGSFFHTWSRAWVIFLIVPMLGLLQETNKKKLLIFEVSILVSALIGIVLPYLTNYWGFSFFGLIIPAVVFISFGEDSIIKFSKETIIDWLLFIILLSIYLLFGILFNIWAWGWMILLIFPAYEIVKQSPDSFKFYFIMPLISVAIFFSLGYFFNLWAYSWLAVLLIPISFFIERD